jgi:ABC-type transport system involved in multi-copper enzyme maturation permease subunit
VTFLPIVQRELQVAVRRKSTARIRLWTALTGLGLSLVLFTFMSLGGGPRNVGSLVFIILAGYAFGLCLLAGVFLTADCLGEENREGTLGLLFLTELKGYDVVLGKFFASSLNAFYGLLALLPITALPLLLGGLTGSEVWRMALVLLNALFLSLATGILVSTFYRDSRQALGNTLGLLLLLTAGLPVLAELGRWAHLSPGWLRLAGLSPFYPFLRSTDMVYASQPGAFWGALLASHLLGWAFVLAASLGLTRVWQEGKVGHAAPWAARAARRWRGRAGSARRARARAELLSRNPAQWLMSGELGVPWGAWAVVLALGVLVLVDTVVLSGGAGFMGPHGLVAKPFGFLLKVIFALQVCRFFAEARGNRALELLLCTPLTNRDIIHGQALALYRNFLWPVLVFLGLLLVPPLAQVLRAIPTASWGEAASGLFGYGYSVLCGVEMVADLFALCWFGMWLALSMKKPRLAPGVTILCVLVLPSMLWWLDLLVDLLFIAWSVSRLQQDLRVFLAQQYQSPGPGALLPPVIARPGVPPVIGSRPDFLHRP